MTKQHNLEAIREALSRIGKSHSDVARELGVDRAVVRGVLYGHLKGARGDAHKVAVALGLKQGFIVDEATTIAEAIKAASASVAA
jgi:gp16 family phage-associated protein